MIELAEKIKKIIIFEKTTIYRRSPERTKQYGRISAFRDVLNMLGENPYFEIPEEIKKFPSSEVTLQSKESAKI